MRGHCLCGPVFSVLDFPSCSTLFSMLCIDVVLMALRFGLRFVSAVHRTCAAVSYTSFVIAVIIDNLNSPFNSMITSQ